jgi:hypothetical protein
MRTKRQKAEPIPDMRLPCPFCGREVIFSDANAAILHALPMCKRYEDEDVITFAKSVNAEIARRRAQA